MVNFLFLYETCSTLHLQGTRKKFCAEVKRRVRKDRTKFHVESLNKLNIVHQSYFDATISLISHCHSNRLFFLMLWVGLPVDQQLQWWVGLPVDQHLCVTSSPLKVYISLGAFQNSDPCRGQSNLVLFVFVLKRGGRGRREGKEGEGRGRGKEGERRGVSVVTKHPEDGGH